ncbi:hypothetical protein ACOHYD_12285 [Desulfobacterota bacterium M19]
MNKKLSVLVMLLALAGFGTAGYLNLHLAKERKKTVESAQRLNRLKAVNTTWRRKYQQQKAIADGMARNRQAAEVRLSGVLHKMRLLEMEKDKLIAAIKKQDHGSKNMRRMMREKINLLAAQNKECGMTIQKKQHDIAALKKIIKSKSKNINNLEGDKTRALAKLSSTKSRLSICADSNLKLRDIANELAGLYKNKGVVGAMFDDERLIQYRQVEVEKLLQAYDERIDKLRFSLH